jgi:hypothetical protein
MKKAKWLKAVNIILFVFFVFQASTGTGHEIIDEELFERIHYTGGVLLVTFVIIHLVLNWGWVKSSYFKA